MELLPYRNPQNVWYCRDDQGSSNSVLQSLEDDPDLLPSMVLEVGQEGFLRLLPHLGPQAVAVYQRCHLLADDLLASLAFGSACDPKVATAKGRHHMACVTLKLVIPGQHCKLSADSPWSTFFAVVQLMAP